MEASSGRVRPSAVDGRFYPRDAEALAGDLRRYLAVSAAPRPRLGVMAPHAGYVYSGAIAGRLFAATEIPRRVIVLGPNHTGRGRARAIWPRGAFALPGGAVPVDEELCARLLADPASGLVDDPAAHLAEHSIEVQLPFLRARRPDVIVTPIVLGFLDEAGCRALGELLARALDALGEPSLVVASSDMNHYLPDDETRRLDGRALEPLLDLDAGALHRRVLAEEHSMCGVIPATVMAACAVARGATRAELLAYGTSGDAFGERDRVVGYAAVAFDRPG